MDTEITTHVPVQRRVSDGPADDGLFDALLTGGPATLAEGLRRRRVRGDRGTIKVEHLGGYEHFERDNRTVGEPTVIYRWDSRTEIAE